jgi:RecB family exonuclease
MPTYLPSGGVDHARGARHGRLRGNVTPPTQNHGMTADALPLTGLPPRLFSATPSRLAAWQDCPRKYRMIYVDRPSPSKGPPWAHNSFGASVHNALRTWTTAPVESRTVGAAGAMLDVAWISDGFRDDAQAERFRDRARVMTTSYVASLDPSYEPLGVERTVATKTAVLALSGRVDRIDDRNGELVVVDYKTGHRPLTNDDARGSMALALYAVAVERTLRRPCRTVELHHLPTGAVLTHQHTAESLARQVSRAEAIAIEARDATEFPARPGWQCAWCDFVRVCPEGSAVGRPKDSWAGLAEDNAD